jgi:hypothetical protein
MSFSMRKFLNDTPQGPRNSSIKQRMANTLALKIGVHIEKVYASREIKSSETRNLIIPLVYCAYRKG